jgi:hypothetical protein
MGPREPGQPHIANTVTPVVMALLLALDLLGTPSCTATAPLEATLRLTDALIARGHADEALAHLLPLRNAPEADAILDRQVARAYAALRRPVEEAAAWEAFLRKSPTPADACPRLIALFEASNEPGRLVTAAERCLTLDPDQPEVLAHLERARRTLDDRTTGAPQ